MKTVTKLHFDGVFVASDAFVAAELKIKISNRVFSHDVTAAILVSQNNETAAILVSQNISMGVELF